MAEASNEINELTEVSPELKKRKITKRGIIYLSSIPPYMNVTKIREIFGQFGIVGRLYLQLAEPVLDAKAGGKKVKRRKFVRQFTEGWVEFEKKSTAKKVAQHLNNTQVSTRKSSRYYDCIWNIKYLSNFKWTHLHERLAYESAARRQKLRTEIGLAKRKANFFSINLDKRKDKTHVNEKLSTSYTSIKSTQQSEVTEDIQEREEFLLSLFKSNKKEKT